MDTDIINMLKTSSKLIGLKQVIKGLTEGVIDRVIIAADADSFIKNKIVEQADSSKAKVLWFDSMERLGELCEIDVSASVVGLLNNKESIKV